MPAAQCRKFPRCGEATSRPRRLTPRLPASVGSLIFGGIVLSSIALILIVLGVILIILSVFGITAGVTPYGMHGGVTFLVIGVILYVVLLLLPTAPV